MHGPLSEIGLIEVLQLLDRGGRSGVLRITGVSPAAPCELHIAAGEIVAVEPQAGDVATRDALAARHLITAAEASDDPDVIARPAASHLRSQLAAQALGAMLQYRRGRFDFESCAVDAGPLSLSPDALVFDLVASESRRVDLAAQLHGFGVIPDFASPDQLATGAPLVLSSRDWRLLDQVDGERDIAAIAAALDEPVEEIATAVQSLHAALILELHQPTPSAIDDARTAIDAGRYDEAAEMLRARVADHPSDGDAWRSLGLAEVGAGRFENAIAAWQSWRTEDPGRADDASALMQAARTMVEALRDARD